MKIDFPELANAIFVALRRRGFADEDIRGKIGAGPARFKALVGGTHQLTDREMMLLEDLADRTIGQLGMEGLGLIDPSLRKVMDAGAAFREAVKAGEKAAASVPRRRRA